MFFDLKYFAIKFVKKIAPKFLPQKLGELAQWQTEKKRLFVIVPNQNNELVLVDMPEDESLLAIMQEQINKGNVTIYRQEQLFTLLLGLKEADLNNIEIDNTDN